MTKLSAGLNRVVVICFALAFAAALPMAARASVSVWLQSPKPGTNPSQVLVYATARSSSAVTGWIIYVDDAIAYRTNMVSDTLSHTVTLTNGRHLLYARAWDQGGSYGTSATLMIQVGTPAPSSSVLPTPPSNATVLSQMQNTTDDWKDCSLCAEGMNDTTNYWMAPFQNSPSKSGSSRELYADGLPWTNVLFIKTMPASTASHFLWDFWVYHDATSAANIWSAEFDLWQVLGGKEFMIGSQCAFGDGVWDTWDSANNRWVENGVPCPRWAPSTWHHVQWYVERINSTQYRYDTLVVDGKGYGFNQTWTVNPTPWPDAMGVQWQLDQNANGIPVHEWIDDVKLTTW
ncbi:MAG TPA: hypothetical protein VKB38_17450 [Terracidiphilus sp.]|nr:hypothetical protein [Terracidiphilus sp.]